MKTCVSVAARWVPHAPPGVFHPEPPRVPHHPQQCQHAWVAWRRLCGEWVFTQWRTLTLWACPVLLYHCRVFLISWFYQPCLILISCLFSSVRALTIWAPPRHLQPARPIRMVRPPPAQEVPMAWGIGVPPTAMLSTLLPQASCRSQYSLH